MPKLGRHGSVLAPTTAIVLAFVFGVNRAAGGSMPPIEVPDTALFDEHGQKIARAG